MKAGMDLKKLTLEELSGVVSIYPWFAQARKEMCSRMSEIGGLGENQFAQTALYMSDRRLLCDIFNNREVKVDCSDKDVSEMISRCMENPAKPSETAVDEKVQARPRYAGADYFSAEEYSRVRRDEDRNMFNFRSSASANTFVSESDTKIYTETLARIYLEQGYIDEARQIYSKLILAVPEKSAYFASLIDKLDKLNA